MDLVTTTASTSIPPTSPDYKGHLTRTQLYYLVAIQSLIILGFSSYTVFTYSNMVDTSKNVPNSVTIANNNTTQDHGTDQSIDTVQDNATANNNTQDSDTDQSRDAIEENSIRSEDSCDQKRIENGWHVYQSNLRGISFCYPPTWELSETDYDDSGSDVDTREIRVESPQGSIFVHNFRSIGGFGIEVGCNSDHPEGTEDSLIYPCTFIDGDHQSFARYLDNGNWFITEPWSGSHEFFINPTNMFTYRSITESDIETLDSILKTVRRFQPLFELVHVEGEEYPG